MACNRCGTDYTNFDLCGNCKQVGELENRVKELVKVLELADDAFGTPGKLSEQRHEVRKAIKDALRKK